MLVFFVLQSTWTVAAQYCQHEENSKVNHLGHHSHKHASQTINGNDLYDQNSQDFDKSANDTDCNYCHLGSIKTIVSVIPLINPEVNSFLVSDIRYCYTDLIPLKPERPNWNFAV